MPLRWPSSMRTVMSAAVAKRPMTLAGSTSGSRASSDSRPRSASCSTTTETNGFTMLPARNRSARRIGVAGATRPRPATPVQAPSVGLWTCRIAPGKFVAGSRSASRSACWSWRARAGSKRGRPQPPADVAYPAARAGPLSPAAARAPAAPTSSVLRSTERLAPSATGSRSTSGIAFSFPPGDPTRSRTLTPVPGSAWRAGMPRCAGRGARRRLLDPSQERADPRVCCQPVGSPMNCRPGDAVTPR